MPRVKKAVLTFAEVKWTADDVKTLRPKWTLKQCEKWLILNEKHLRDRLIEHGWVVMNALLDG